MTRALLASLVCLAAWPVLADAPAPTPAPVAAPAAAPALPAVVPVAPTPTADARLDAIDRPAPGSLDRSDLPITDNTGYLLFKTLVVLGIVLAIIYLTLNVGARRLLKLAPTSESLIQVVDRVPLDAKKTLYVISAAGEYLLVGSTETGLNLISKLPTEEVQHAMAKRDARRAASGTFLDRLQALAPSSRKPPV